MIISHIKSLLVFIFSLAFFLSQAQFDSTQSIKAEIDSANAKMKIVQALKSEKNFKGIRWVELTYEALKIYIDNEMIDSAYSAFEKLTITTEQQKFVNKIFFMVSPIRHIVEWSYKEKYKTIIAGSCALLEKEADSSLLIKIYDKMSAVHHILGEYEIALRYAEKADNIEFKTMGGFITAEIFIGDKKSEFKDRSERIVYYNQKMKNVKNAQKIEELNKDLKIKQLLISQEKLETSKRNDELKILNQEKEIQSLQQSQKDKEIIKQRIFALENSKIADLLNTENRFKGVALKQQTKLKNVFIGGFSVLAIMIFFLVYFIRQRQIANKELRKALIDLKGTQEQLVHQEKMASLGQLTAGIAHEIQNPLNFVNNFSEISFDLIKEAKEETNKEEREKMLDSLSQNLEKVNHHGKRAQNVVKNMLLYSRSGHVERQEINLNLFVEEILNLSYQSFQAKYNDFECKIEKEYKAAAPIVKAIPQDFSRMFLNLFNNAFYALREKTKKSISGYVPVLKVGTHNSGQKLIIKIYDNGDGIPAAIQDKIYNPFFTTKPTGEGTGLGLGIGYDIIKAHGGELSFKSVEGEFTEFEIRI